MRVFWALILWLMPVMCFAQTSTLRTGEHDGFTRIVIDMPAKSGWKVGQFKDGFGVHIEGVQHYDLGSFFDRLSAQRITDATVDRDTDVLHLATDCACSARAFVFERQKLVVDIRDGTDGADPRFNGPLDDITVPSAVQFLTEQHPIQFHPKPLPQQQFMQVTELEDIVTRSLSRAAAQGFLSPASELPVAARDEGAAGPSTPDAGGPFAGIETRTGLEAGSRDVQGNVDAQGIECLPDDYFAVPDWGDDRPFGTQVAEIRRAIGGEFDRPNSETVIALARLYIYFGFGLESKAALDIDGVQSRERWVLRALGALLDDESPSTDILNDQYDCNGSVALWGFLAHPAGNYDQPPAKESILRNFKRLPKHLQVLLGPRLSQRFSGLGEPAMAEQAIYTVQQSGRDPVAVALAKADLPSNDPSADVIQVIEQQITNGQRVSPEALVTYFTQTEKVNVPAHPEVIAFAEVARFELRDTEPALTLKQAQILALLRNADPVGSLRVLTEPNDPLSDPVRKSLSSKVLQAFTDTEADARFLDVAFGPLPFAANPSAQNNAARRLMAIGFSDQALEMLQGEAQGADMADRRMLRAEAQLQSGRAQDAIDTLSGLTTDPARALRREAELTLSQSPASIDFAQADPVARDWRQGNWGGLTLGTDALLRTVSQAVLRPRTAETAAPTLAAGRDTLAQSQETRELMTQLLQRFAPVQAD